MRLITPRKDADSVQGSDKPGSLSNGTTNTHHSGLISANGKTKAPIRFHFQRRLRPIITDRTTNTTRERERGWNVEQVEGIAQPRVCCGGLKNQTTRWRTNKRRRSFSRSNEKAKQRTRAFKSLDRLKAICGNIRSLIRAQVPLL